jgi:drug/metabolite transporter (DMT)-like permease
MSAGETDRTQSEPAGFFTERTVGVICAIGVILLFSSFTLISRLGFSSALTLPDIAALRFGIGGMALLPFVIRHGLSGLSWRQAATLAFLGGLGFALFAYTGFSLAPAAHGAVLLHGTLPLWTFVLTTFVIGDRSARAKTPGILLILAGVVLMAADSWLVATPRQLLGDLSLLLASLCWSSYAILARRYGLPPARSSAIVAVLSMACFLPVYAFLPGKALLLVGWQTLALQAVFQGLLIGALSIFIYTKAVSALGAAETALFTAAVPCVTTLAAIPLLSEIPGVAAVAGVIIVTTGMVIAMRR